MESCTGLRVTLVYMSKRRNCARFGAPTGSVDSSFINERKKWYSCEHSSCLLQKIMTHGSLRLDFFSAMANGVKASSMLTFCRTLYAILGLSGDAEIIAGLMRPRIAITLSLV